MTAAVVADAPLARVELRFAVHSISLARALQARFDRERPPGSAVHVGLDGDGLAIRVEAIAERMADAMTVVLRGLERPLRGDRIRTCLDRVPDAHEEAIAEALHGTGEDCLSTAGTRMRRVQQRLAEAPAAVVAVGAVGFDLPFADRPRWVPAPRGSLPDGCPAAPPATAGRVHVTAAWPSAGPDDAVRDLVLADGYGSRLTTRLRRSEGLVYDVVYARSGGYATATVEADGGALPRLGLAICEELTRPIASAEVAAAAALARTLDRAAGDSLASAAARAWDGPPSGLPSPAPTGVALVVTGQ